MLGAGVVISGLMSFTRSDITYALVLIWAFTGISARWLLSPISPAGITAAGLVFVLLIASRVQPSAWKKQGLSRS
jgi:hypothetical protein